MRIRILIVGNRSADAEMLKDRGFAIYTCNENTLYSMLSEVRPVVIFINSDNPQDSSSTRLYNQMLDNVQYASYPIMYTLAEDDVYLVNKKRTASKDKRTVITDNIIDGIKMALQSTTTYAKTRKMEVLSKNLTPPFYANRA